MKKSGYGERQREQAAELVPAGLMTQSEADAGVMLSQAEIAARKTAGDALSGLTPQARERALLWFAGVFGAPQ